MKLEKFAEKEQLKDHLLYLIKQDEEKRIDEEVIESTSTIIMKVMDAYEEIKSEEGEDAASGYLFNVFASYIMMGHQQIYFNEELIKTNEELLEKLNE